MSGRARRKEWFDDDSFWYGSLEGDPYGIDAQRLVAEARRAPAGRTGEEDQ